jgi:hypothetical protein
MFLHCRINNYSASSGTKISVRENSLILEQVVCVLATSDRGSTFKAVLKFANGSTYNIPVPISPLPGSLQGQQVTLDLELLEDNGMKVRVLAVHAKGEIFTAENPQAAELVAKCAMGKMLANACDRSSLPFNYHCHRCNDNEKSEPSDSVRGFLVFKSITLLEKEQERSLPLATLYMEFTVLYKECVMVRDKEALGRICLEYPKLFELFADSEGELTVKLRLTEQELAVRRRYVIQAASVTSTVLAGNLGKYLPSERASCEETEEASRRAAGEEKLAWMRAPSEEAILQSHNYSNLRPAMRSHFQEQAKIDALILRNIFERQERAEGRAVSRSMEASPLLRSLQEAYVEAEVEEEMLTYEGAASMAAQEAVRRRAIRGREAFSRAMSMEILVAGRVKFTAEQEAVEEAREDTKMEASQKEEVTVDAETEKEADPFESFSRFSSKEKSKQGKCVVS